MATTVSATCASGKFKAFGSPRHCLPALIGWEQLGDRTCSVVQH